MEGQSRKWMILVATTWIQAFTGTNFDFSSYSSDLKTVLEITQVQLNYLSVASDMGKAFGWCSGVSLMYLPLWVVMFMAAFMGLFGYGLQWLVIQRIISLPYFLVIVTTSFFNSLLLFIGCVKGKCKNLGKKLIAKMFVFVTFNLLNYDLFFDSLFISGF